MSLRELCETEVVTCTSRATVTEAARLMRDHHVGAVIVVDDKRPVGIVTDRDLTIEVLASSLAGETAVKDVMTPDPACVHDEAGLADAAQLMREHGVRRLPVVTSDGELFGVITLDDILSLLGEELASLAAAVGHERLREWRERGPGPQQGERAA
jgi:CBS domain-containing protein